MKSYRRIVNYLSLQPWPWLALPLLLLGIATTHSSIDLRQDTYRYLFAVDITQSMNVGDIEIDDVPATRLDFAKIAIATALRELPCGSEVGLGIFAGHRTFVLFTPVEVCDHYRALINMLEKVDWRIAWAARSEVAKGLYSAIDAARLSDNDTRLVFLTDGHEAPPINEDIRPPFRGKPGSVAGFIGGIGGPVPSQIPHLDDNGNIVGYWSHDEVMQIDVYSLGRATTEQREAMVGVNMTDIASRIALGQEHLSSLRENHLQELATQTGLDYVRIESPSGFIRGLRQESYARRTPVMSDLGWIPATLALICLTYCFVLQPRMILRRQFNAVKIPL